jgi:hypothetical protein
MLGLRRGQGSAKASKNRRNSAHQDKSAQALKNALAAAIELEQLERASSVHKDDDGRRIVAMTSKTAEPIPDLFDCATKRQASRKPPARPAASISPARVSTPRNSALLVGPERVKALPVLDDGPANPTLLSKADFLAGFVPPNYLIDRVLQRRFIYALTASTGHGKTALALLIAQLIADSDPRAAFLGRHAVDKGNVIYFAGENPDDLRMRVMAADAKVGHDGTLDRISFIAGTFGIEAMRAECEAEAEAISDGKIDLVVVDTSAAYFFGDEENSNTQMGSYARTLRSLTNLPGGPCVLVLCHPTKNANEQSQLLPRGGGAFIAEIDGNLTLWKTGELIELWHTDKMRGPGFEPMTFRLEKILCDALIDAKGRHIPTIRAVALSDSEKEAEARTTRSAEDQMLVAMLDEPGRSIAVLAIACGWISGSGDPQKSKAHRILKGLEKSGLARLYRGAYELTDKGKTAAIAAKATAA